jgi:peptide/nickel transport system substrate-binding protein/oligopeptide transport system substrate-binding protein
MMLVGTLALLLSACGNGTTGPTEQLAADQTLNYPYSAITASDLDSFDPAHTQWTETAELAGLIFPQLLTQDAGLNVVPLAATGMPTISTDGKTYTFKLRPNLKWSDGQPITSADFALSIDRAANPCIASEVESYASPIKDADAFAAETCGSDGKTITGPIQTLIGDSVNTPDAQTLAVTISKPSSYFIADFTYPIFYATPKHVVQQYGDAKWTDSMANNGTGFGGGAFMITKWDHSGNIHLDANPNYFGGAPKLKHINIPIYKDAETAYTDYLAGKLDTVGIPAAHLAEAKTRSDYFSNTTLTTFYLTPNWAIKPFDDVRVRQAFELAIDKQAINNTVYKGANVPTNHIVPPGMPGYQPNLKGPDGTQGLTGNPTQAKSLITAYAADKCGGNVASCPAVTFTYRSSSTSQANLAQALLQMWQQNLGGYPVTLQTKTSSEILHNEKNLQLFYLGWQDDYPYPQDFLSYFFEPGASYASNSAFDPATVALLQDADQQSDQAKAISEYEQAEQNMVTQVGWLPLFHGQAEYLLKNYVAGYKVEPSGQTAFTDWPDVRILKH